MVNKSRKVSLCSMTLLLLEYIVQLAQRKKTQTLNKSLSLVSLWQVLKSSGGGEHCEPVIINAPLLLVLWECRNISSRSTHWSFVHRLHAVVTWQSIAIIVTCRIFFFQRLKNFPLIFLQFDTKLLTNAVHSARFDLQTHNQILITYIWVFNNSSIHGSPAMFTWLPPTGV